MNYKGKKRENYIIQKNEYELYNVLG